MRDPSSPLCVVQRARAEGSGSPATPAVHGMPQLLPAPARGGQIEILACAKTEDCVA